ncbi:hypothetical protein RIVM261_013520 [Rivularia sp. IAM M-261]|nr:hypothetical protein RIVM261_013520 [Rivularia sp. IAM M-261]
MNKNRFPADWDGQRVRGVIAHYEEQTEEQATLEDEAALKNQTETVMEVKSELMPVISKFKKEEI